MAEPGRVVSGRRATKAPEPSWEQEMRRVASRWGTTALELVWSKSCVCVVVVVDGSRLARLQRDEAATST